MITSHTYMHACIHTHTHTHTHIHVHTYRGVEIVSQLPNILTYFQYSCPVPHILCIQLSLLGMILHDWLAVSTHISLFYYMCVHSHSLHTFTHNHMLTSLPYSSSVYIIYVPSYHSHIFTHFYFLPTYSPQHSCKQLSFTIHSSIVTYLQPHQIIHIYMTLYLPSLPTATKLNILSIRYPLTNNHIHTHF